MTPEDWNLVVYDFVGSVGWGGAVYLASLEILGNLVSITRAF